MRTCYCLLHVPSRHLSTCQPLFAFAPAFPLSYPFAAPSLTPLLPPTSSLLNVPLPSLNHPPPPHYHPFTIPPPSLFHPLSSLHPPFPLPPTHPACLPRPSASKLLVCYPRSHHFDKVYSPRVLSALLSHLTFPTASQFNSGGKPPPSPPQPSPLPSNSADKSAAGCLPNSASEVLAAYSQSSFGPGTLMPRDLSFHPDPAGGTVLRVSRQREPLLPHIRICCHP